MFVVPLLTLLLTVVHGSKQARGVARRRSNNHNNFNNNLSTSPRVLQSVEPIIDLDGDLSDWPAIHRAYPKVWELPALDKNFEIYGLHHQESATYYFAIKRTDAGTIGASTTVYLDTNQSSDSSTADGLTASEFIVECVTDAVTGLPTFQLYSVNTAAENRLAALGNVEHVFGDDQKTVEIAVPAELIGGNTVGDLDFFVDVNDSSFLPMFFGAPWFTATSFDLPGRTVDPTSKRVGIVFSPESEKQIFGGGEINEYIYGQLYASIQHQCMNAGIPFDLLYFDELKDMKKIVNYDALVFPYNAFVSENDYDAVLRNLRLAVHYYGIGVITGDNFYSNLAGTDPLPLSNPYQAMWELLGVTINGYGAGNLTIAVSDATHPVTHGYAVGEEVLQYASGFYNHYGAISAPGVFQTSSTVKALVDTVTESSRHSALLAIETTSGARNVHFGTVSIMADANLMWRAIRWAVFGDASPIGLQISRHESIFSARNDMDQSRFRADFDFVTAPLVDQYLSSWNQQYNFVGTDFINIGNNPSNGEYTDWAVSGPLYERYTALGDEIASHTYTHPDFITQLTETELKFEFEGSGLVLQQELGLPLATMGYAQPGNPEDLRTVNLLDKMGLYYLSGTYTGKGVGFPSAFGKLSPSANMTFMAPNMFSDFNMLGFKKLTPAETFVVWTEQYQKLRKHANTPIVHFHWHDYAPFDYSETLIGDTIAMAYNGGSEFIVNAEMAERMKMMRSHELLVSEDEGVVTATVSTGSSGTFGTLSLDAGCKATDVIKSVDSWYAYSDKKVLLPKRGGTFVIHKGAAANDKKTRIVSLPMRAELIDVTGDGTELQFEFIGNGKVTVKLNEDFASDKYIAVGATSTKLLDATTMELTFDSHDPVKTASIVVRQPNHIQLEQRVRIEKTAPQKNVCKAPYHGVRHGGKLKLKYAPDNRIFSGQRSAMISTTWYPSCWYNTRILISTYSSFTRAYLYDRNKIYHGILRNCGTEFWTNGPIGGVMYIHVQQGYRVQTTRVCTTCSEPIQVGDVYGSVRIVDFIDTAGSRYSTPAHPNLDPGLSDDPADEVGGPSGVPGDTVVYTYVVTNPSDSPLCHVQLSDLKDDVNGRYSSSVVQRINDSRTIVRGDHDQCLEKGEQWAYTYNYVYNQQGGRHVAASSTASATDEYHVQVQATDKANYRIH